MTDRDNEIRKRCEAATPGPWYWDVIDAHKCICLESARWKVMDFARYGMHGAAPRFLVDGIMERADALLKSIPGKEHHRGFDNYIDHPDAAFIAASRTDVPYLLDRVAELEKEIAAAHGREDAAYAELERLREAQRCEYVEIDDDKGLWQCSECGNQWVFNTGNPYDNEAWFCPACGAKIVAIHIVEWDADTMVLAHRREPLPEPPNEVE